MSSGVLLAVSTFPDVESARRISRELVESHCVACANLGAAVESIYRWEGKVESSSEVVVMFKLAAESYDRFERRLRELHSYEVPEIIALPIEYGSTPYLEWVRQNSAAHA